MFGSLFNTYLTQGFKFCVMYLFLLKLLCTISYVSEMLTCRTNTGFFCVYIHYQAFSCCGLGLGLGRSNARFTLALCMSLGRAQKITDTHTVHLPSKQMCYIISSVVCFQAATLLSCMSPISYYLIRGIIIIISFVYTVSSRLSPSQLRRFC